MHEGLFVGTHTCTLRTPAGDYAPTGRVVDVPFCGVHEIDNGKITDTGTAFPNQAELLAKSAWLGGSSGARVTGLASTG